MTEVASFRESPAKDEMSFGTMARSIFLAWEKLRLIYIGVIGAWTLLLLYPNLDDFRVTGMIIEGAIVANICYFVGPTVEAYANWLGFRKSWLRYALFTAGLVFTALLVLALEFTIALPDQD